MPIVEKFLFDREFGASTLPDKIQSSILETTVENSDELNPDVKEDIVDEVEDDENPEIIDAALPLSYSESEFELAVADAFEKGEKKGTAAINEMLEQQSLSLIEKIEHELEKTFSSQEIEIRKIFEEAILISMAIPRKLFPTIEKTLALSELERAVSKVLELIIEEPKLTIIVPNALKKSLEDKLKLLTSESKFSGKIQISGENDMSLSDCKIQWGHGSANRNTADLYQEIDAAIERYLTDNKKRIEDSLNKEANKETKSTDDLNLASKADHMELSDETDETVGLKNGMTPKVTPDKLAVSVDESVTSPTDVDTSENDEGIEAPSELEPNLGKSEPPKENFSRENTASAATEGTGKALSPKAGSEHKPPNSSAPGPSEANSEIKDKIDRKNDSDEKHPLTAGDNHG